MRKRFLQISHLILLGWLSAAGAGCGVFEKCSSCMSSSAPKEAPRVAVESIDMFFEPFIHRVDNTQEPGASIPGLAGRVWLFGAEGEKTLTAKGKIVAELYDMTPVASGAPAVRVTGWTFESKALKQVEKQDKIGVGYTLFLPLQHEYHPGMKKVQVRLAYIDENGGQHPASPSTLLLRGEPEQFQINVEHRKAVGNETRVK